MTDAQASFQDRLAADRVENMANHEKIVFYELVGSEAVRRSGDPHTTGGHLAHLGLLYAYESRFEEAVLYTTEAVAILKEIGDELGAAKATLDMAVAHASAGDLRRAEPLFGQALEYAVAADARELLRLACANLVTLHKSLADGGDDARRRLAEVERRALAAGDDHNAIRAARTLAESYTRAHEQHLAVAACERALVRACQVDDPQWTDLGLLLPLGESTSAEVLSVYRTRLLQSAELHERLGYTETAAEHRRRLDTINGLATGRET
ncbi:hypothetical protein [Streptomyces sp. F001]|uniref:hypothetical protein n=1 Tax=Streptomyces sp. F001 TaxID=1510026 RepID=UPI00101E2BCB|nr:hypothetical protein [Streptomyces sp. F001]RZB13773.1 hypothetical protein StrepF001_42275 [Streptomyces sp. F001]